MIIYKAVNKINGRIYIGQTTGGITRRFRVHLCGKSYFDNALRKYGIQSFDISVIDAATTREELNEKESYWIKFHNCISPNGYNITPGGDGVRGQIGDKNPMFGKHRSQETRDKISAGHIGKHLSEEHKRKIGESSKGRRPMLGKRHSGATKLKMRLAHKGKKQSEEWVRKRMESKKGFHHTDETRKRLSDLKKEWYKNKIIS